jgi:hypothetical protein
LLTSGNYFFYYHLSVGNINQTGDKQMFIIEKTEIAKAIENARLLHPVVLMVRFGLYTVTGSKGNTYTVRCWRDAQGKNVDCSCATRDDVACKHGMAAVPLHSYAATTPLAATSH